MLCINGKKYSQSLKFGKSTRSAPILSRFIRDNKKMGGTSSIEVKIEEQGNKEINEGTTLFRFHLGSMGWTTFFLFC